MLEIRLTLKRPRSTLKLIMHTFRHFRRPRYKCPYRYKYNAYCRLFITDGKICSAKPKIGQANLESLTLTDFYCIADFSLSLLLKNCHTFHCWCRLYYSNFSRKLFQNVHKINKYSLLSSVFHNIHDSRFRDPRAKRIS